MKKISKLVISLLCATTFASCEETNDNNSSNYSSESSDSLSLNDGKNYLTQNGLIYELYSVNATLVGHTNELSNNVVIPSYVTFNDAKYEVSIIEKRAFYNCSSLTSIFIPLSAVCIREGAFEGCNSLTIYCENSDLELESNWNFYRPVYLGVTQEEIIYQNGLQFLIIDGKAVITGYTNELSNDLVIPETILVNNTKYDVTTIGESAFRDCNSLFSVTFEKESKVSNIEEGTFFSCSSLISIIIPNNVTSIKDYAFKNCSSLTIYCEASNKPIEWNSYWNASGRPVYWEITQEEIIYQNGLHFLIKDGYAIVTGYAKGLSNNVVIPSAIEVNDKTYNVISIGYAAFYNCSSLTSIVIPSSVMIIENYAFSGLIFLTVYCEAINKPSGWSPEWNHSNRPVYWSGQWSYVDGVPTPNK